MSLVGSEMCIRDRERIGDIVAEVFAVAEQRGITTLEAADELALARLREPANACLLYTSDAADEL